MLERQCNNINIVFLIIVSFNKNTISRFKLNNVQSLENFPLFWNQELLTLCRFFYEDLRNAFTIETQFFAGLLSN